MGWIANRKMITGHALYDGGPKRKGPLRKIKRLTSLSDNIFGCDTGWLECGHWSNRIYGAVRAICTKCATGEPRDIENEITGWPEGKEAP